MSAQHKQGKLVVAPTSGSSLYHVHMEGIRFGGCLTLDAARRLAACWNAFEGVCTEMIEATVGTGSMQLACDSMLKLPEAQSELAAARALLRKVLDGTTPYIAALESKWEFDAEDWTIKARSYLDACETLGEKK